MNASTAVPGSRADAIRAALQAALSPEELQVEDDSDHHAGHAGHAGGDGAGSHFNVRIRAAAFAGKARVARHRLVYDALAQLMPQGIHALAIEARAPGE